MILVFMLNKKQFKQCVHFFV